MAPLRGDTQHETKHTLGTEPDLTLAPQPDDTRRHPMPTHFPSHLLPVFPKCSQLLRLFRLLHGRLLSLQLLSNLKHKMLSAYVIRIWADRCLGALERGQICPVLQTGAQRKPGQEAQRLSTLSRIPKVSVVEPERDLPTPSAVCSLMQNCLLATLPGETNFSPTLLSAD